MNNRYLKFENPVRLEELKPSETLLRIGLKEDSIVCDIGAGSGIFTIPAAKITKNTVYALDIDDEMLSIIAHKRKEEGLANIALIKVQGHEFNLSDHSVDIVLLVTVLHEIKELIGFLSEVKRIIRKGGRIVVVEFLKEQTPMGPPVEHRLGKETLGEVFNQLELTNTMYFEMGGNFYCLVIDQI